MSIMRYYVDVNNIYLGGWDANPPDEAIEVPYPPIDARQTWNGESWDEIPIIEEPAEQTALEKLQNFLKANPDVVELLNET